MKNLNNIMNLNRHYVLLLLMVILMIPSQDLSAKKKKQVKEPTDRELWSMAWRSKTWIGLAFKDLDHF